jgi:hypothetical protein
MNRIKLVSKIALAAVLTVGAFGSTIEAKPKCPTGILCPTYYDPVICDNGQVYSNSCFASAACAKNCVPYGTVAQ